MRPARWPPATTAAPTEAAPFQIRSRDIRLLQYPYCGYSRRRRSRSRGAANGLGGLGSCAGSSRRYSLSCSSSLRPGQAWGQGGHYTVCEIGYLNLTPAAKAEVDRLVALDGGYASFTETCTFPDKPLSRASEHYCQLPARPAGSGPGCPGGRPCVVGAIDERPRGPALAHRVRRRQVEGILNIGHWYGDLHQPLHISFADDRGGNSVDQRAVRRQPPLGLGHVHRRAATFGPGSDR